MTCRPNVPQEEDDVLVHDTGDALHDMIANLNELPTEVLEQLLHNLEEIEAYNALHGYDDDDDDDEGDVDDGATIA